MRRVHSLAWFVLVAASLAVAVFASPAEAALLPVQLGQPATEATSGFATSAGGCTCTLAQFGEVVGPSNPTYVFPYDGVIVASGFYVGNSIEPTDTVQVQTVHRTGSTSGTVVNEGVAHSLVGLTKKAVSTFYERLPAHAGDVLAARFNVNPFIQETPYFFKAAAAGDETESFAATAAGGALSGGSSVAERRLNLEAVLEPDEDGDGHGDVSQDLCPGSPIAVSACSGSLLGSSLQGPHTQVPFCGGGCMRVQTSIGGVSTAAPTAGVVVRWRVMNTEVGDFRLRVLEFRPESSGGSTKAFKVLHASAQEHVASPGGALFSRISSFPTRLPIPAGAYVGISGPSVVGLQQGGGATNSYTVTNDVTTSTGGVGLTLSGNDQEGTLLYDADIEPDVDGDGYGDVTQDSCPSVASIHEGPCPAAPPSGGGGAPVSTAPVIKLPPKKSGPVVSALSLKPKSFHAKPLGPVAARGSTGTKIHLTLSAKATVTLAIETKQGRRFKLVTKFARTLKAGRQTIAFSGQYRHAGKLADLAPGTYRLGASAKSAAGTGPVERTTFTVLPPA